MTLSHLVLFGLIVACAERSPESVAATPPDAPAAAAPSGPETHGVVPPAPVPNTPFAVVAHDGTPRDASALLGKPTALWFYPAAATPG